jgi:hypothetical protein
MEQLPKDAKAQRKIKTIAKEYTEAKTITSFPRRRESSDKQINAGTISEGV